MGTRENQRPAWWRPLVLVVALSLLMVACGGRPIETPKSDGGNPQAPPTSKGESPGIALAYTPPVLGAADASVVIQDFSDFL